MIKTCDNFIESGSLVALDISSENLVAAVMGKKTITKKQKTKRNTFSLSQFIYTTTLYTCSAYIIRKQLHSHCHSLFFFNSTAS